MNPTIENVDVGSVVVEKGLMRDDVLTFTGAATYKAGTLLARDSVSKKFIPYVKGGTTNEDGIVKALLTSDVTSTAAGDVPFRYMMSGAVKKQKLIILADGDDSNVDSVEIDGLRDYGFSVLDVQNLSVLDNQ